MTELKCPLCNSNLTITRLCDAVFPNPNKGKIDEIFCDKCKMRGTEELWQALIDAYEEKYLSDEAVIERTKELNDTKKKLDMLQEFITKLYLNGNITDKQLHWLKQIKDNDKDVK